MNGKIRALPAHLPLIPQDPIEGEDNAADEALEQIANNMFNEAVSSW